ncbi:MAG: metallophosphoesterase [Thermoflexales bacterium]
MFGSSPYVPSRLLTGIVHPFAEHGLNWGSAASPIAVPALLVIAILTAINGAVGLTFGAMALAAVFALAGYMRYVAAQRLATRELVIDTHGRAAALTLAFISDAHLGRYKDERWLARVVARINDLAPDAVLIGGDFFFNRGAINAERLLAPLADLRAPLGTFAIFGNHDVGLPGRDRRPVLEALLPALGIRVLSNCLVSLSRPDAPGGPTWIAGMGELWLHDFRFHELRAAYSEAANPGALIVLGHNPDAMHEVESTDTADLFLFGHTHAGQIHLPFWPGFGIPSRGPWYRGDHTLPQGRVYVTSGIGETSSSCRLGTTCEVVVVKIR